MARVARLKFEHFLLEIDWYIPDNPRRLANWLAETALWEIVGDLTEEVATEAGREAEGGV